QHLLSPRKGGQARRNERALVERVVRSVAMQAILRVFPRVKTAYPLAAMTFIAGASGMAVSFLFLASAHHLDVIAGAAGFIAGSILAAAGLISISLQGSPLRAGEQRATADEALPAITPPLDVHRW